jgi:hypothetical protein
LLRLVLSPSTADNSKNLNIVATRCVCSLFLVLNIAPSNTSLKTH